VISSIDRNAANKVHAKFCNRSSVKVAWAAATVRSHSCRASLWLSESSVLEAGRSVVSSLPAVFSPPLPDAPLPSLPPLPALPCA
jgi:hypothetical protein